MAQVKVIQSETGGDGSIHFEVELYRADGVTPLRDFRRTVVIAAPTILTIANDGNLTNAQKRQAVYDVIRAQVVSWGIADADDALTALNGFLPAYPLTFSLKA